MAEFFCGSAGDPDGPVVVWAVGDIDSEVAARLAAEIEPHLNAGSVVVLTCAGIASIDAAGLGALLHAARTAAEAGAFFQLATLPQPVLRAVEAAGLERAFAIHETVGQALAEAVRRPSGAAEDEQVRQHSG